MEFKSKRIKLNQDKLQYLKKQKAENLQKTISEENEKLLNIYNYLGIILTDE